MLTSLGQKPLLGWTTGFLSVMATESDIYLCTEAKAPRSLPDTNRKFEAAVWPLLPKDVWTASVTSEYKHDAVWKH